MKIHINQNYWDMESWTYGKSVWAALLSDDRVLYQNDTNGPSWIYLKDYLLENNLYIKNLGIKYFDHEEWLNDSGDGYYFSNGAIGFIHSGTFECKNIGVIKGNEIHVKTYRCPELLLVDSEVREYKESEYTICNTHLV